MTTDPLDDWTLTRHVACHEAAHIVVGHALGRRPVAISIASDEAAWAISDFREEETAYYRELLGDKYQEVMAISDEAAQRQEMEALLSQALDKSPDKWITLRSRLDAAKRKDILILLAGAVANALTGLDITEFPRAYVADLPKAQGLAQELGYSDLSPFFQDVKELLGANWSAVAAVSEALLIHGQLSGAEVEALIKQANTVS